MEILDKMLKMSFLLIRDVKYVGIILYCENIGVKYLQEAETFTLERIRNAKVLILHAW